MVWSQDPVINLILELLLRRFSVILRFPVKFLVRLNLILTIHVKFDMRSPDHVCREKIQPFNIQHCSMDALSSFIGDVYISVVREMMYLFM